MGSRFYTRNRDQFYDRWGNPIGSEMFEGRLIPNGDDDFAAYLEARYGTPEEWEDRLTPYHAEFQRKEKEARARDRPPMYFP